MGRPGCRWRWPPKQQPVYTVLGIGQNVSQAFAPYQTTIKGEHIGIIAATQVIDSDLQTAWTATATQPGLASAYDVDALVAAVEAARRIDDTVVVFLHWGVELDACPDPLQEPLANVLVRAGADIIVGATPMCSWGAATSARPTSTTVSGTSPSTTPLRPPTRAGHWSSRPPVVTSTK